MPPVNRPQDPVIVDHSTNDPPNAAFDHRFEAEGPNFAADAARIGAAANVSNNVDSTCIIIKKQAAGETSWTSLPLSWVDDASTPLISMVNKELWTNIRNSLRDEVRDEVRDARQMTRIAFEADLKRQKREDIGNRIDALTWPDANTIDIQTKFPPDQWLTSRITSSRCYLGGDIAGTAGHCVTDLFDQPGNWMAAFG